MSPLWLTTLLFSAIPLRSTTANSGQGLPLVINTWAVNGFLEANKAAWKVLAQQKEPGSALDALVAGCSTCERLQCDGTVGFGGSPDEKGETTLDAMIMDGATMNIGAVAGMRHIKNAIGVARHVLEHTGHTLLVGNGATDFAEMMGFKRESLASSKACAMWRNWRGAQNCQPNFWVNVQPNSKQSCGPYSPLPTTDMESCVRTQHEFGPGNHDTIGMIVIDENSQIYAGTSTNGARFKIHGRVGDSPIPGAGAYADNEVGAAVATGDGDVMMRFLPSLMAVEFMRAGQTPDEAARSAMQRILKYYPKFSGGLVVANRFGNFSAACVGMDKLPFSVAFGCPKNQSHVRYVKC